MKVCHVLTYDPKTTVGGVETVVRNLAGNDKVFYTGRGGLAGLIKSIWLSVRIALSDCDIVHAHDSAIYGYTLIPRRFRKKKILCTFHGLLFSYFQYNKPEGFAQNIKAGISLSMHKRIIKNTDVAVSVAKNVEKNLSRIYDKDSIIIHNGVETTIFKPRKIKKEYDLLWVGTNPRLKNLKFAIDYANSRGSKLAVAGLKGRNTRNVEFLGNIPPRKMPYIYNKTKALIYNCKIPEYPLVVLEAMASGADIIANSEALADFDIKPDGRLCIIKADRGRKIAAEFDWRKIQRQYRQLYREMLKK